MSGDHGTFIAPLVPDEIEWSPPEVGTDHIIPPTVPPNAAGAVAWTMYVMTLRDRGYHSTTIRLDEMELMLALIVYGESREREFTRWKQMVNRHLDLRDERKIRRRLVRLISRLSALHRPRTR